MAAVGRRPSGLQRDELEPASRTSRVWRRIGHARARTPTRWHCAFYSSPASPLRRSCRCQFPTAAATATAATATITITTTAAAAAEVIVLELELS